VAGRGAHDARVVESRQRRQAYIADFLGVWLRCDRGDVPQESGSPMDSETEQLWSRLLHLLPQKRSDATKIDALNRLAHEQVKGKGLKPLPRLDQSTCAIARETWPMERLLALQRRHGKSNPACETVEIAALHHDGHDLLIDGTTRLKWERSGRRAAHQVIVVSTGRTT
jgi:hypothetical protein